MTGVWIWIIAVAAVLALLGGGNPAEGVVTALALATRGPRLTHAPSADDSGIVDADPQALADEAGLSLEAYALARAISSEEGNSSTTTQAAVAWAIKNAAARGGRGIFEQLCRLTGYFGSQVANKYASTARDPYDRDGQIALQVLDGTIPDSTGGATNFDRPAGENADKVTANRLASHLVEVAVDGADSGLRFWRPA